jgi:hypothetical protein
MAAIRCSNSQVKRPQSPSRVKWCSFAQISWYAALAGQASQIGLATAHRQGGGPTAGMEGNLMNRSERLALIKSTLSAIPLFTAIGLWVAFLGSERVHQDYEGISLDGD